MNRKGIEIGIELGFLASKASCGCETSKRKNKNVMSRHDRDAEEKMSLLRSTVVAIIMIALGDLTGYYPTDKFEHASRGERDP